MGTSWCMTWGLSAMRAKAYDVMLVAGVTLLAAMLMIFLGDNMVVRTTMGLLLVLVLPGYAMTAALFPGAELGLVEHSVIALGMSLAVTAVGGLLLNLTPWGLRSGTWLLLLAVITLAASAVALWRRRSLLVPVPDRWELGLTAGQGIILSVAVVLVGGAMTLASTGADQQPSPGFSQFWILPASGPADKHAFRLGVANMESTSMTYRVEIDIDGNQTVTLAAIRLSPHQTWQTTEVVPSWTWASNSIPIEAKLYRSEAPKQVYRHVELWLRE